MLRQAMIAASLAAAATGAHSALAQTRPYIPPIAKFDGTNKINLPADPALDMISIGTIEFWAAATWTDVPELDPAVVANNGPEGPRYSVHITKDRAGVGLYSADGGATVPFDFSDGKLHHVALVTYEGGTEIYVDGKEIGIVEIDYADVPTLGFHIGSFNGVDAPFIGGIAGLRIWDTLVDIEELTQYRATDILSRAGREHPDFDGLVGVSNFADGHRGFYLMGPTDADQEAPEDVGELPEGFDPESEPDSLPDLFGALDGYVPPESLPDDY